MIDLTTLLPKLSTHNIQKMIPYYFNTYIYIISNFYTLKQHSKTTVF